MTTTPNTITATSPEMMWAYYALGALAVVFVLLLLAMAAKNRRISQGQVFVASRFTRGNRIFPTQVAISPTSVVQRKPQWLGRREESINIGHVASVKTNTGLLFSDVIIETSGGSEPILCHGHSKGDAVRMKALIEQYQGVPARVTSAPAQAQDAGPTRACPFCAETIKAAAKVCRYCGRDLPKTA